ncbi:MAG: hypothetical protein AAFV29_08330, partial [Myxococcota bacterium]
GGGGWGASELMGGGAGVVVAAEVVVAVAAACRLVWLPSRAPSVSSNAATSLAPLWEDAAAPEAAVVDHRAGRRPAMAHKE